MPLIPVRFYRSDWTIRVGDQVVLSIERNWDTYFACTGELEGVSATGILNGLRSAEHGFPLRVSESSRADFDPDYAPLKQYSFTPRHDGLGIEMGLDLTSVMAADDGQKVRTLLAPFLQRRRARLCELTTLCVSGRWGCVLEVCAETRGRAMDDLVRLGDEILKLLAVSGPDGFDKWSITQLLRAGLPEALLGLRECDWFDAKSQDYDLGRSDHGKISLAQDVARFANSEGGGVIAIGFKTKRDKLGERVRAVAPLNRSHAGLRRHRQAVDTRIYPLPDGLLFEEVEVDDGILKLIYVPTQDEELKPFLVHGAVVGSKVEGAFISIVRRRGEESIPMSAASIHTMLAAGRALLRRGELPLSNSDTTWDET